MKQLFQSIVVGLLVLQGLACAGSEGVDAEDTAEGRAESAAREIDLSPEDIAAEEAAPSQQEAVAPQSVKLLSPTERAAQLGALTGGGVPELGGRALENAPASL